jgi:hypothetical protein
MDHHSEDFERMKADLHEKGYQVFYRYLNP